MNHVRLGLTPSDGLTMRVPACKARLVLWLIGAHAALGCTSVTAPLDLSSADPTFNQRKIAELHSREAAAFRLKAQDLSERIRVYALLFGPDSDWVSGTRLLEQYYLDSAEEQERLAGRHLDLTGQDRTVSHVRPVSP
ncbi:hypothetical protein [Petrachloros mirabilis]